MKYSNAKDLLPEELLSMIQNHFQGGYLYIPKGNDRKEKRKTDYKIELEKRNQHIYLKYLEGRTNEKLGNIYHLSEASIRRIISKEKVRYQKMKEMIEQMLPLWGIECRKLLQIYPSAWEVNDLYVIKVYEDKEQLERNIKTSEILLHCNIPAAKIVPTEMRHKYVENQGRYFIMSEKLKGSNISDVKNKTINRKMGCAIAQLHAAFVQCESEIDFWDNSLLMEMRGWIRESLENNEWRILCKEEYLRTVELLESVYDFLPKQLIHRDVHYGNFLFTKGDFSGYIDFDLSQRNIRIFDICYFLTGLLAEETEDNFTEIEWIGNVKSVVAGYESIIPLSEQEKNAIPYVMECIEILFIAYFIRLDDTKQAADAYKVFLFIQNFEREIRNTILDL